MLPYPLLFLLLVVFWLLLNGFSLGHLLLGSVVALVATWGMAALRPDKPVIRRWDLLARLAVVLAYDIMRSNLAVAAIILGGGRGRRQSAFVTLKLDLTSDIGLAVLSVILTSTPGTAWLEYNAADGTLLMHVLDLKDADAWRDTVKNRYEKPLREIFG
ncbi:Na+/H+ antiporter subunit E [Rhizobium sp. TRM95111]|uniref:Na+/H+ antiporter subunit E n=1 Tax=Rhizobium alarense TaxID=2846851 RepID=UPI001F3227BB|nr:Na+/H+ antiporter subunit E [Rhizobium alarense]MCF3641139.1 Na+/H+ antiporter subunit E [Rhizobium alarense]